MILFNIFTKKVMKKNKTWERKAISYKLKEPKRWWHYLGVKQKEYDYTISFYLKSEESVEIYGTLSEWY